MIPASFIKEQAAAVGFDACGVAEATMLSKEEFMLEEWLDAGFNAGMDYMQRNVAMRQDPRLLVEGARSVISVLLAYKPDRRIESARKIAQYAYGEDYHERLKRMLYQLITRVSEHYPEFEARPFVDTAPISDRHWAARAGLGWLGKNTLLVNPRFGSYCFIGELVTTAVVDVYDTPLPDGCGDCSRCVDACPNRAIVHRVGESFHVDARRCTSYNTIENRDSELPSQLDTRGYVFGCDICQLACPYNEQAPASMPLGNDRKAELESLPNADETAFRHATKHSAMNRINYAQWRRNVDYSSEN